LAARTSGAAEIPGRDQCEVAPTLRLGEIAEIVQDPNQTIAHEEFVQALIRLVGVWKAVSTCG